MTLKANTLQIIVIIAAVISQRNDMINLSAWLDAAVSVACLTQSAIALE